MSIADSKGLLSLPYLLITIVGIGSMCILGNVMSFRVNPTILLITFIGIVIAQQITHCTHDLKYFGNRKTLSKKGLKLALIFFITIDTILVVFLVYLTSIYVLIFVVVGIICVLYTYIYRETLYGISLMFVVIGSYYSQTLTITLPAILMGIAMFWFGCGGIHLYRLDHYLSQGKKLTNEIGVGVLKLIISIPFIALSVYFLVQMYQNMLWMVIFL